MNEIIKHYSKAEYKAAAVAEIETLIAAGTKVRPAVEGVAYRTGISERSLYRYLKNTRGVPLGERESTLVRKPSKSRPKITCHPDALKRFIELASKGIWVTKCYRQVTEEAKANGWGALPSERTLRRRLDPQVSSAEQWIARRGAKPEGEV